MKYPDTINLPFNKTVLEGGLVLAPRGDDDGSPGPWLIISGSSLVVTDPAAGGRLPEGDTPPFCSDIPFLYLGLWRGKPLRVMRLPRETEIGPPWVAEPFNAVEERLDDHLLSLGGLGMQVLHWERQSSICPRCGAATEIIPGGWGKRCSSCRQEIYPQINPCVIVLVRRGDEFLLARKEGWIHGRYGLVAGFVDLGESLEECVSREVLEETGINVGNIRYVGSQNWPFPSQLMTGFVAEYAGGEIVVDRTELEDARWFRKDSLPLLPPRRSIARWIIDNYALGPKQGCW